MNKSFSAFKAITPQELAIAWDNGLFVFDTSVLLNIYRYRAQARKELLNIIGIFGKRKWLPNHVALEFYRNRPTVIAAQHRLLAEVKDAVEKSINSLREDFNSLQLSKIHSIIDVQPLLSEFEKQSSLFNVNIDTQIGELQTVNMPDPLRQTLEALFSDLVGLPPADQNELDNIYKEAEQRFSKRIPPGYKDLDKGKDEPDEHIHGGIVYKRKYGDYLIWRQLLEHAAANKVKYLFYITDDAKEDWWWKVNSNGPKNLGPRPELIDEAQRIGGVEIFQMYDAESLLFNARQYMKVMVSEETISEAREVKIADKTANKFEQLLRQRRASRAVWKWLERKYKSVEEVNEHRCNYVAHRDGENLGFYVIACPSMWLPRRSLFQELSDMANERGYDEFTLIIVVPAQERIGIIKKSILEDANKTDISNIRIILGMLEKNERNGFWEFQLFEEFRFEEPSTCIST